MGYFNTEEYFAKRQQTIRRFIEASDQDRIKAIERLCGPFRKQVERLMYPFRQGQLDWWQLEMPVKANGLEFNFRIQAGMVHAPTGQRLLMGITTVSIDGQNVTPPALLGVFQACLEGLEWVDFGYSKEMQSVGCYNDTVVQ